MSIRFLKSRTTLGVRDVQASIEFYGRAVGFEVLVTMGEPPSFASAAPARARHSRATSPGGNYDFVIADPDGHQVGFGEVPSQTGR